MTRVVAYSNKGFQDSYTILLINSFFFFSTDDFFFCFRFLWYGIQNRESVLWCGVDFWFYWASINPFTSNPTLLADWPILP
jgi:hypothetical protein